MLETYLQSNQPISETLTTLSNLVSERGEEVINPHDQANLFAN